METSQAVSMLQPFRHPKPGLTIMDKAEELRDEFLGKYYPIEFITNIPDLEKGEQMEKDLDKYAQQVSREVAVGFTEYYCKDRLPTNWILFKELDEHFKQQHFNRIFDEWKSKQEKPDINDPKFWEHVGQSDTWLNESKYKKALKEWKSNQEDKQ